MAGIKVGATSQEVRRFESLELRPINYPEMACMFKQFPDAQLRRVALQILKVLSKRTANEDKARLLVDVIAIVDPWSAFEEMRFVPKRAISRKKRVCKKRTRTAA